MLTSCLPWTIKAEEPSQYADFYVIGRDLFGVYSL